MPSNLCVSYAQAIHELGLSECATFGVSSSCGTCSGTNGDHGPWTTLQRERFAIKLAQAHDDIKNYLDFPICETEVCDERHKIDCPITLRMRPIKYLGKRVVVEVRDLPVLYKTRTKCGIQLPTTRGDICKEDELVGVVILDNIPDGVLESEILFSYDSELCFSTDLLLEQPCLETFVVGDSICEESPQVGDGFYAVWPKCQLLHPNCGQARITDDPTEPQPNCWIQTVTVTFTMIDESLAIRPAGVCSCGACPPDNPTVDLTATISDATAGEICLELASGSNWINRCTCHKTKYVYVTYAADVSCLNQDSVISFAVALRTLLLSGRNRLCGCDCFAKDLDWWLQQDPGEANRALSQPADYPFGTTRAGVEISRTLNRLRDALVKRGETTESNAGVLDTNVGSSNWRSIRVGGGTVTNG